MALSILPLTSCLIADPPDGEWSPLTNECVPLGTEPTAVLHDEPYLRSFLPAGDSIVFDDADGLTQLSLRDHGRRLAALINSDGAATEVHRIDNELIYFTRGAEPGMRDLVVDRGAALSPRWITIGSIAADDSAQAIALRIGVLWRSDREGVWHRWNRATETRVDSGLPDSAEEITTDGELLFYEADTVGPTSQVFQRSFYTLPIDGVRPSIVDWGDRKQIIGVAESRLFAYKDIYPKGLVELIRLPDYSNDIVIANVLEIGKARRRVLGGGYLYWVANNDPTSLKRVSLTPGDANQVVEVIATVGDGELRTIKTDACNVYWRVERGDVADLYARGH